MRHSFFLATMALALLLTEQHAPKMLAAPFTDGPHTLVFHQQATAQTSQTKAGQAHKAKGSAAKDAPVISEVDLEALKKLLQRGDGAEARPLLVNFWATWCEPCREEFPDLVRINSDYAKRNLEVITISLDDPADIKTTVPKFLREVRAVGLPSYVLNVIEPETVINMIDPEWGGGLPATFLYDASGKMVFKHTGRFNAQELRAAIDKVTSGK
jgi:thiol-disulfide isomerase/thioredoxin